MPSCLVGMLLAICSCDSPELRIRKAIAKEKPIGEMIADTDNGLTVRLPDGKEIKFNRTLTHDGFFDESTKTLAVSDVDGTEMSIDFGQGHSGYSEIAIRCSSDYSRIWVIDLGALHLKNGAAIDLESGFVFDEGDGWPVEWATPEQGHLVVTRAF